MKFIGIGYAIASCLFYWCQGGLSLQQSAPLVSTRRMFHERHRQSYYNNKKNSNFYYSSTPLFAGGFGNSPSSKGSNKKGSTPKSSTSSNKKMLKIKQRVLEDYGGDIAKGTEQRVQTFMNALPPEIQRIAELYKKVRRWDAYVSTLSVMQQANIPQQDLDGAKRARALLDTLLQEQGLHENDIHNIFQKITWDASADAKAMNAKVGKMPDFIQERVDKACGILAASVKSNGRKDGRCLDVGCGHGTLVPNLFRAGIYPSQITGVDLSSEMIRNAKATHRGVNFIATDFLQFNPDEMYDGIIFCSALHDLPDMELSLAKAASLLRPGGKLVLLHAQGAQHVVSQHRANPVLVKRLLPDREELAIFAENMKLMVDVDPSEPGSVMDEKNGYLAVLSKPAQ